MRSTKRINRIEQKKTQERVEQSKKNYAACAAIKKNIIEKIASLEPTSHFLAAMSSIISRYLHGAWFIQSKDDDYRKKLQQEILIKPLGKLFEGEIRKKFPSVENIDNKIEEAIIIIFQDFLDEKDIENKCILLLSQTINRLTESSKSNGQEIKNRFREIHQGLFSLLYCDALFAYNTLQLPIADLDRDNRDKVPTINKMTGLSYSGSLLYLCNDVTLSFKPIYLTGIVFLGCMILKQGLQDFSVDKPQEFLINNLVLILSFFASISGYINKQKQINLDNKQVAVHSSLTNQFVRKLIVESLLDQLEQEEKSVKNTISTPEKGGKPTASKTYTPDYLFQPLPQSSAYQKVSKGKDKERDDEIKKALKNMKNSISHAIDEDYPMQDPTWFQGERFDLSQFKKVRKSLSNDYFVLLPGVDTTEDHLFEGIEEVILYGNLKALKNDNKNTTFQCQFDNQKHSMKVEWELTCHVTTDRILVGRINKDEGCISNLYVGFKLKKQGYHKNGEFNRELENLNRLQVQQHSIVDLSILPKPKPSRKLTS